MNEIVREEREDKLFLYFQADFIAGPMNCTHVVNEALVWMDSTSYTQLP